MLHHVPLEAILRGLRLRLLLVPSQLLVLTSWLPGEIRGVLRYVAGLAGTVGVSRRGRVVLPIGGRGRHTDSVDVLRLDTVRHLHMRGRLHVLVLIAKLMLKVTIHSSSCDWALRNHGLQGHSLGLRVSTRGRET